MKVGLVVEEAEGEERHSPTPESSEWSVSGGVRTYPVPGYRREPGVFVCLPVRWISPVGGGARVCSCSF